MGDGKKMGYANQGKSGGGGLKALKKPLAPLSKPSGNSNNNNSTNLMGFGMAGTTASDQGNNGEIDLLGVINSN